MARKVSRLGGLDNLAAASEAQLVAEGLPKLKARRIHELLRARSPNIKVRIGIAQFPFIFHSFVFMMPRLPKYLLSVSIFFFTVILSILASCIQGFVARYCDVSDG